MAFVPSHILSSASTTAVVALFLLALLSTPTITNANIVSESRNRLPMSLSAVITDMEADGMTEIYPVVLVTSRSVTRFQRQILLQRLLHDHVPADQIQEQHADCRAVATSNGLALAQPEALDEVVQSCVACRGRIIFCPSPSDLQRGEGLMDALAPAMERLVQFNDDTVKPSLVVIYDETTVGKTATKSKFEAAAASMVDLEKVFTGGIQYVTAEEAISQHSSKSSSFATSPTTPEDTMSLVARVVTEDGSLFSALVSPPSSKILNNARELAAARALEPIKRQALIDAHTMVKEATNNDSKLVLDFGALTDAILQQAIDKFIDGAPSRATLGTSVGKELANTLQQELSSDWMDTFERQLELLEGASFASFQQSLGQLRLGPTLPNDMKSAVQKTVTEFGKAAAQLVPKRVPGAGFSWKARAKVAQMALQTKLTDFCQSRLEAAEASGQFRPVPRKGVTIGMHWLLPKPFGNDYRQEPWMVHATDNLVYVPRRSTKVTDVPAEDVMGGSGDWRDQVVPSPAGRDMLYMQ